MHTNVQVHSYGKNRKVGQVIEIRSARASGIVAVGKIVAIAAGAGGAVVLTVRLLAGG
jgi:hypothetical protein